MSFLLVFLQNVIIITHNLFVFILYASKFKFNFAHAHAFNWRNSSFFVVCFQIYSNVIAFHSFSNTQWILIFVQYEFYLEFLLLSFVSFVTFPFCTYTFFSLQNKTKHYHKNISFQQHKSERFQFDWEYTTDVKNWITGIIDMKWNEI